MKEELMKKSLEELRSILNQKVKETATEVPDTEFFKKFEEKNEKHLVTI